MSAMTVAPSFSASRIRSAWTSASEEIARDSASASSLTCLEACSYIA